MFRREKNIHKTLHNFWSKKININFVTVLREIKCRILQPSAFHLNRALNVNIVYIIEFSYLQFKFFLSVSSNPSRFKDYVKQSQNRLQTTRVVKANQLKILELYF